MDFFDELEVRERALEVPRLGEHGAHRRASRRVHLDLRDTRSKLYRARITTRLSWKFRAERAPRAQKHPRADELERASLTSPGCDLLGDVRIHGDVPF